MFQIVQQLSAHCFSFIFGLKLHCTEFCQFKPQFKKHQTTFDRRNFHNIHFNCLYKHPFLVPQHKYVLLLKTSTVSLWNPFSMCALRTEPKLHKLWSHKSWLNFCFNELRQIGDWIGEIVSKTSQNICRIYYTSEIWRGAQLLDLGERSCALSGTLKISQCFTCMLHICACTIFHCKYKLQWENWKWKSLLMHILSLIEARISQRLWL